MDVTKLFNPVNGPPTGLPFPSNTRLFVIHLPSTRTVTVPSCQLPSFKYVHILAALSTSHSSYTQSLFVSSLYFAAFSYTVAVEQLFLFRKFLYSASFSYTVVNGKLSLFRSVLYFASLSETFALLQLFPFLSALVHGRISAVHFNSRRLVQGRILAAPFISHRSHTGRIF